MKKERIKLELTVEIAYEYGFRGLAIQEARMDAVATSTSSGHYYSKPISCRPVYAKPKAKK